MDSKRQCSKCGRQFEDGFEFCPFDATPLGRKCSSCGKVWDADFQFCPLDSTALAAPGLSAGIKVAAAAPVSPASPGPEQAVPQAAGPVLQASSPVGMMTPRDARLSEPTVTPPQVSRPAPPAAPPVAAPRPASAAGPPPRPMPNTQPGDPFPFQKLPDTYVPKPTEFTFIENAQPAWKAALLRPMTILFVLGAIGVGTAVWYLNSTLGSPDLPVPQVSYSLLPNEGKTKGVPVAIKVDQATVFMIDDPMETAEGAARAKQFVGNLQAALGSLKGSGEVRFAVDTVDGKPALVEVVQDTSEKKPIASLTDGDLTLAGETDPTRLAGLWAERLTDAVRVFVLGEAPSFSTETDFGRALLTWYKTAAGSSGKVSKRSLDSAFQRLSAAQHKALEDPPTAATAKAST